MPQLLFSPAFQALIWCRAREPVDRSTRISLLGNRIGWRRVEGVSVGQTGGQGRKEVGERTCSISQEAPATTESWSGTGKDDGHYLPKETSLSRHQIMLIYTHNKHNFIFNLYLNKAGRKKKEETALKIVTKERKLLAYSKNTYFYLQK